MGSWGAKAFQNDSALDWLAELEVGGAGAVRATLASVADAPADDWIDVDDGAAAIAAAEVVAAALGDHTDRVPEAAIRWLAANRGAVVPEDLSLARRAVERVLGAGSELRGLWDEGEPDPAWSTDVRVLLARLEACARAPGVSAPAVTAPSTASRPRAGVHEKQALLAFLGMRGLTPTAAQLARIEKSTDLAELRRWLSRAVDTPSVAAMLDD